METGSDPYTALLRSFGAAGAVQANKGALQMFLGIVKRPSPLEIDVNGTVQRAADGNIWCNQELVIDRNLKTTAEIDEISGLLEPVYGQVGMASLSSLAVYDGKLSTKVEANIPAPGFAEGDRLIMLTRDQQSFYILCKEVRV